ncbi:MAG: response regulator transcription factor [Clostridia bacterium]|nr:response regulator transcription factor [Clostridia bacterium]
MIKVVIADDQELLREGIKVMIEQDKDIKVVGCAKNGREAFALCNELLPDLVLMDLIMPECDGVEGTKLVKAKHPDCKVLILTVFGDRDKVSSALSNGADGYALKDIKPEELVQLIKSTVSGLQVIHKNVFATIIGNTLNNNTIRAQAVENSEKKSFYIILTDREKSIVRLIVQGKSNKEIAASLSISEGRVRNVMTSILEKLKLEDRTQLAIYAVKNDIV